MKDSTRKKLEMGKRALAFSRAHPDSNPVYNAAVARLEALLDRAEELERQEQNQQKLARPGSEPQPNGKVIPFRIRSKDDDPTPPAA